MSRTDYRYQNFPSAAPQTRPHHQQQQQQTAPASQQSYRRGGYKYAQPRALQPKPEKPPPYPSSRQHAESASVSYTPMNKKPAPSQAQKGQLKWTNYIPSSFGGRNPNDCVPNQQLMQNLTGSVRTSPTEHRPASSVTAAVPPSYNQSMRNATQSYNVQSGQSFPNQNYPPQPVQSGQSFPNQNYPPQSFPNQNYPPQSFPSQNYPPQPVESGQSFPNQNYPPQPVQKPTQQPFAYSPEQTAGVPHLLGYNGLTSLDAKKHEEVLMLLNVYRKVKRDLVQIYMERKLERQNMQLSNGAVPQNTNSMASLNPQVTQTPFTANTQAAPGPTSGRATDQQNTMHGVPVQVMNKGNQLHPCPSQNFDSSQSMSPDMRNMVTQDVYAVSDVEYLSSMSALSHPNQSFNLDSVVNKEVEERAMTMSLVDSASAGAVPQASRESASHQFASNVRRECGTQGGLPKQADFSTTSQAHGEAPRLQGNGAGPGVGLENARGRPDNLKDSLPAVPPKENEDVLSRSLEALETCLSLWKSQNTPPGSGQPLSAGNVLTPDEDSDQSNSVSKECMVGTSDASDLSGSTFVVSGFNQEGSSSSLSKVMEPQIAIVSPLVQSNMKSHTDASQAETPEQCPVIEEGSVCSLSSVDKKGTLPLGLKVQLLKEFNAVMGDLEVMDKTLLHGGLADCLSVPKSSVAESESELIKSNEERDANEGGSLQISSICSLVEGNSFYDSAIAMIFGDGKGNLWPVDKDMNSHGRDHQDKLEREQDVGISEAPNEASLGYNSERRVTDVRVEGLESPSLTSECSEVVMSNEDLGVDGSEMERSPTGMYGGDLGSTKVSDQLSDLLTEFPFGIENYAMESKVENPEPCGDKVEQASPPPIKTEKDSVSKDDLPLLKEISKEDRPLVERVSSTFMEMLVNLENMEELPGKDTVMDHSSEGVDQGQTKETSFKDSNLVKKETEQSSNQELPDKNLFCCLFSWMTHAYGGAPKCSCKLPERDNAEKSTEDSENGTMSSVKDEGSKTLKVSVNDTMSAVSSVKVEDSGSLTSEDLQEKVESRPDKSPNVNGQVADGNGEDFPAANVVCKQEPCANEWEPQVPCAASDLVGESERSESCEGENTKPSCENTESVKPHSSQSKKHHRPEGSGPQKPKSDQSTSRKGEKLIVKTDFLKNRNSKDKKKHWKEMKRSQFSERQAEISQSPKDPSPEGSADRPDSHRTQSSEGPADRPRPDRAASKSSAGDAGRRPVSGEVVGNVVRPLPAEVKPQNRTADPPLKNAVTEKSIKVLSGFEKRPKETPRPLKNKDEKRVIEISRKVLTVQEYLQRKRKLNEIRSKRQEQVSTDSKAAGAVGEKNPRPEWPKAGHDGSKHRISNVKMRKSPAKAKNVPPKLSVEQAALAKSYNRLKKEREKMVSCGATSPRKMASGRKSHGKMSSHNLQDPRKPAASSKDKIYLSPCVGVKRQPHDSISLTKLQIGPSPDLTRVKNGGRRKSLESGTKIPSLSNKKHANSPKMLEFKLFPELLQKSPLSHEHSGSSKAAKEKCGVEAIKSKKEAWCRELPAKKRKLEGTEEQGDRDRPPSPEEAFACSAAEKEAARQSQDSRATFDTFKKLYLEKKSKSYDGTFAS
ncbi:retroelement silencing factor 1 [Spea bombifrons]|uniref:retroelement silencing factor 1 n=1 Tax=Spea bombifrons TaxID=233779 RepID=UPI002349BF7F|nr:retroelement silencing factor 1 [Spea bombifrons]